jgi:putative membrane protein
MNSLVNNWSFDTTSAVTMVLFLLVYIFLADFKRGLKYSILFIALSVICLFSPLHLMSAQYLFSAHMTVHVLILLVLGPLVVLGMKKDNLNLSLLFKFLQHNSFIAWLSGVGIMWFWHLPVIFNSSMALGHMQHFQVETIVESLSLLSAGILFSAPIIHPNKTYRIGSFTGVLYLFTACVSCSVLGLLITFSPVGTYHHFLSMHDPFGYNQLITRQWGFTQAIDQQAAGLIMWVPCCFIYVTGAMYLLMKGLNEKEQNVVELKKL